MLRKTKWLMRLSVMMTVLALAGAMIAVPVSAQMLQLPHSFYGSVKINGQLAPLGTQVEARCDGATVPEDANPIMISQEGYYGSPSATGAKLVVQGADIEENADITFYVNGYPADQTFLWKSGEITKLNITVTIPEETSSGGGGGSSGGNEEEEETSAPTPTPISQEPEPEEEDLTTVITPQPEPETTPEPSPAPANPEPKPTTNPAPAPAPEESEPEPEPAEDLPADGESFFDTLNWYWVGGIILVGIIIIMLLVISSAKRF